MQYLPRQVLTNYYLLHESIQKETTQRQKNLFTMTSQQKITLSLTANIILYSLPSNFFETVTSHSQQAPFPLLLSRKQNVGTVGMDKFSLWTNFWFNQNFTRTFLDQKTIFCRQANFEKKNLSFRQAIPGLLFF